MPEASAVISSSAASSGAPLPPASFVCTWQTGWYGAAWVHLAGELDVVTSPQLEQTLSEAQHAHLVVLDLRELTFIDCLGMQLILDAACRARQECGRMVLVRGPAEVDRALTLTGTDKSVMIIDLDPTEPTPELFDLARASGAASARPSRPLKARRLPGRSRSRGRVPRDVL